MISQLPHILGFLAGFILTILTGYLAVSVISREMPLRFRVIFSMPLGFGINSIIYFLYLYFNYNDFKLFRLFEITLLIILALMYFNEEKPDMSKHQFKKLSNWFYLLNVYAVLIFLKYFINNPLGSWDGFRIWNIKAEFLFQDNPLWRGVFSLPHFMSHNDYPMFLPSLTARLWSWTGAESAAVNVTLGLIFTFALVYLLFQAISYFKSEKTAIVVTSVFMISDIFLVNGASQCADIPLALFFLSAIVCLFMYFKNKKTSYIILGIIFAGLSAWTKNEGMMFFLIYSGVTLGWLTYKKDYRKAGFGALTAIIATGLLVAYKKITHSPNDLIEGFFLLKTYSFAFDWNRYAIIFKTFFETVVFKFALLFTLALLTVKGFRIKEQNRVPFFLSLGIFALMVIGYFAVYLLSPHDIEWLVENSMDRIILQILPVFLFLFTVNLRIGKPDSLL